jgi:hypothetical protein
VESGIKKEENVKEIRNKKQNLGVGGLLFTGRQFSVLNGGRLLTKRGFMKGKN